MVGLSALVNCARAQALDVVAVVVVHYCSPVTTLFSVDLCFHLLYPPTRFHSFFVENVSYYDLEFWNFWLIEGGMVSYPLRVPSLLPFFMVRVVRWRKRDPATTILLMHSFVCPLFAI